MLLSLSSVIAMALTIVRVAYTGGGAYVSLVWNLFLAWIPMWAAIPIARGRPVTKRNWTAAFIFIGLWLLFFPNSPYLLTDFIHLAPGHGMTHWPIHALDRVSPRGLVPPWYDVLLLFAFAWNGMMLALTSLHLVRRAITRWTSPVWGWVMVVVAVFLCGFGVTLGRFERFNSWDIISKPGELLSEVFDHLLNPVDHLRSSVSTLILAMFLLVAYLSMAALVRFEKSSDAEEEAMRDPAVPAAERRKNVAHGASHGIESPQ